MEKYQDGLFLGVDIGGTHIEIGVFLKVSSMNLIDKVYLPVDAALTKEEILSDWKSICSVVKFRYSINGIGIAFPAPFDYDNGVCLITDQIKFQSLYQVNLKEFFGLTFGLVNNKICFLNDAEAFLRGEVELTKTKGSILLLTLGTGLGSARKEGENVFDEGLWSFPFMNGIAENYFSTSWFIQKVYQDFDIYVPNVKELISNQKYIEIVKLVFNEFADNLSKFIILQFNSKPFETVVLGGSISKAFGMFLQRLQQKLFLSGARIEVRVSNFSELAPLYGAASHAALTIEASTEI